MRTVDKWPGHDPRFFRDLPDEEPPLTEDEARREREDEQDRRFVERLFQ